MSESGESKSRRKPWLASLLCLVWPGVGQLYNGSPLKGVGLAGVSLLCLWGMGEALNATVPVLSQSGRLDDATLIAAGEALKPALVWSLLFLGVLVFSLLDAYRGARPDARRR
ncbi:MAG: hypothetical protein VKP62_09575 [Candidatus Sericytochromatia bacterium]|nr:hypothetical protein [Candidatus Sericytochromatia bacterium]